MNNDFELTNHSDKRVNLDKRRVHAWPGQPQLYPSLVEQEDAAPLNLGNYWRALRRRLWLIVAFTLLMTLLAAIYMAGQADNFEAEARVQVDLENNPAVGSSKTSSVVVSSPVNDPTYFSTQLQILTGSGLLRRVVKTLDLEHNQDFTNPQLTQKPSIWGNLMQMIGLRGKASGERESPVRTEIPLLTGPVAPATPEQDLEEAQRLAPFVEKIKGKLTVEPVKDTRLQIRETRLISIRLNQQNPQVAAKIVNAMADALVLLNLEKRVESNTTASDFLQKRIAELQAQIRTGEEQLLNYAKSNQILSLDAGQDTVVARLTGLNGQLLIAENDRKLAEANYRAMLAPGAADASAEDKSPVATAAENKLTDLRQKRAQMMVEYTDDYPEVKEIDTQITELEKQVKEGRRRASAVLVTNLDTTYRQALAREQSLRAAFNQQRAETVTQNQAAVNYKIYQQEIDTAKTLLDGLLQRSKENDVILAAIPNNIHVTDYAITPRSAVGPKRAFVVSTVFMLTLFLSVGLVVISGFLDTTMGSVEDAEESLGLPVIAIIPSVKKKELANRVSPDNGALQAPKWKFSGHPEILPHEHKHLPLGEAYRKLRTSFLLSISSQSQKRLLITSALPSEGKTTVAINLALVLAKGGANVLLIDADLRHSSEHPIFNVEKKQGLGDLLSKEVSEGDALLAVRQSHERGIFVLSSGDNLNNPAEVLGSERMRSLMAILAANFTYVIIDSPPVSLFTDSVLLSSMVDSVMLVIHGHQSPRQIVQRSLRELQDVGANVIGVVLNNVKVPQQDYYSYYRAS